jgi:uncharacterized repeat protein (TIGR01451 family)
VYPDAGLPATPPPVITVPPSAALPVTPPPSVDAQFAFPATTIAQAGHPLVLTTIVTRRTDRAPLPGWTVRYEVANTGAALGPTGGSRVEVPTDAAGRASIEIRPTSVGVGDAIVNMVVVPPLESGAAVSPAAEVGRGVATITWKDGVPGAPPWLAMPTGLASTMPQPSLLGRAGPSDPASPSQAYPNDRPPNRFEPPPSLSDSNSPPKTYGPPPKLAPAGKPELVVDVHRRGPERVEVGGLTSFDVVVTNRGDATARGIKVLDRFDPGLSHVRAKENELAVKYEGMKDLAPGDSATVALTFGVQAAGQQCHHVTVWAEGAAAVDESGCITAIDAKPTTPPTLEVTKIGPIQHFVGELAMFRIVIKNTGDVPVTNLEVVDRYDEAFEPRFTDPGREILPDGSFKWRISRLEKGERREINVRCACVTPAASACSTVTVTADGDVSIGDEKCVEIMLPLAASASPSGGVTPPPPHAGETLKLSTRTNVNPARVGGPTSLSVFVENTGPQPQRDVKLRVLVPQEMTPDQTRIRPLGSAEFAGPREIRFNNIGELRPGDRREFEIPLTADRPGVVTFWAEVNAAGLAKPITAESIPIQIESASQ